MPDLAQVMLERHLCIDTTAAGGNASLLLSASGQRHGKKDPGRCTHSNPDRSD